MKLTGTNALSISLVHWLTNEVEKSFPRKNSCYVSKFEIRNSSPETRDGEEYFELGVSVCVCGGGGGGGGAGGGEGDR